jgi:acyl dehydratase
MTTQQLDFDRSQLGVDHPAGTFRVEKEAILTYCQAIGETDPVHTDEAAAAAAGHSSLLAPPTFCAIFARGLGRPDIKLKFGRTGFHASEAMEMLAPVHAGDQLTATTRLKEVYAKTGRSGTMVFVVWETSFSNQAGEPVANVQESHVRRE